MLVFEEGGKPEYTRRKTLGARREPKTNSTHVWHRAGIELGYIGRRAGERFHHRAIPAPHVILVNNLILLPVYLCIWYFQIYTGAHH